MRTIAVANQKGGVGKTTTAVSLAADLARQGQTVALVDLDPQGNASVCLGIPPGPGLARLLMGMGSLEELLIEARPGLWVLPSDASTAEIKLFLAAKDYREELLARALSPLAVDYCILDCAPSRDVLHTAAHHMADQVIIPVALDYLALAGVLQEMDTLRIVREHGHPIEAVAILPTFWDKTTNESGANLRQLVGQFGELVTPAVSRCVRLREAPAFGQTIWEYLPEHHQVREAYGRLTRRLLHG